MVSPKPQPIPQLIHRPAYYVYPRPQILQPNVGVAGHGFAGVSVAPNFAGVGIGRRFSGVGVAPQLIGVGFAPQFHGYINPIGWPHVVSFVPHPAVPFIRQPTPPMIISPNNRILAVRRSVSHDQHGIEQIGTGNNILQGNVQQIQLGGGSRKGLKRRGLMCDTCFNFLPQDSNLFRFTHNFAQAFRPDHY